MHSTARNCVRSACVACVWVRLSAFVCVMRALCAVECVCVRPCACFGRSPLSCGFRQKKKTSIFHQELAQNLQCYKKRNRSTQKMKYNEVEHQYLSKIKVEVLFTNGIQNSVTHLWLPKVEDDKEDACTKDNFIILGFKKQVNISHEIDLSCKTWTSPSWQIIFEATSLSSASNISHEIDFSCSFFFSIL